MLGPFLRVAILSKFYSKSLRGLKDCHGKRLRHTDRLE